MTPSQLTQSLKKEAKTIGFDVCGAAPAVSPAGFQHFQDWLSAGYHGEMSYLEERQAAYQHPSHVLDGAVSVLMLGINYQTAEPTDPGVGQGRVSRYAWSDCDYHDVIHAKLKQLVRFCREQSEGISVRGVIDTAPLLEREFAQLAGIGWRAKNTMLISREIGSWFFLAALLLDQPLDYDEPFQANHCGTCTACLDACPTDAFVSPHQLDATRCISYLTIEHRSPIPHELRGGIGDWVFGCDVCQDVCPWNKKPDATDSETFLPREDRNPMALRELFELDDDSFRLRFRKTPLWRPKRRGILRNAAIVLGNRPDRGNIPSLSLGLADVEPLVRGASAWALGQHELDQTATELENRLSIENDGCVRGEIELALNRPTS